MADEILSRDENRITVTGAITNDADEFIRALRIDESTKRLLVSAVITSGGGGGTQYDTNAAYADGDTGTLALTIRDDSLSTLTEADGDYSGLRVTSTGRLWSSATIDAALPAGTNAIGKLAANDGVDIGDVSINNNPLVALISGNADITGGAGAVAANTPRVTLASDDPAVTSLQLIDNTVYTEGDTDTTITGIAMLMEAGSSTLEPVQGSLTDGLLVNLGSNNDVTLTSTTITGTVAVTQSGTWDEVGINDSGNSITVDSPVGTPTFVRLSDGSAAISTLPVSLASVPSHAVTNAGTFATQATLQTQTDTVMVGGVNIKEINAVTPLMGNGVTGTGSLRVTVASDNTAFSVNSTLSAETTKVIGVVRTADGSGNLLTATSNALDVNIKTSAASNISTNVAQINGVTPLMGVGATGTGSLRVVEANGAGRTLAFKGGSVASSGDNTLVAAGTNKLKVYAFSLTTTSTTAMTCKIEDGASGTVLWQVVLQAPTSVNVGANLAVTPPAYLFATSSATLLNLNLSSANTVHYSVAYFDEA